VLLAILLAICVARLWLMPLASSFWVDEMATVFVARYGAGHASLATAAPQAWQSVYYYVARGAMALAGSSEIALRLPSVIAMAGTLFLVSRLAARLIGRGAAWFAVFACLALGGINYEAADARPYALGMCVAAASLLFLVRWLDSAARTDALLFLLGAGLLWRVHLLFWPLYPVFALYAALRLARRETPAKWREAGAVFALLGLALAPVLAEALALYREAGAHVIAPPPSAWELARSLKWPLVAVCGLGAWACGGRPGARSKTWGSPSSLVLILGWWLCQPLFLFAFSRLTGNSVFVPRYLCLSLPGAALAATMAAAFFTSEARWKPLSVALAAGVLLWMGQWRQAWPLHHNSDWRAAARAVNRLPSGTPVICPSPFVEAVPPAWRPDYRLPGFFYAHLSVYPVRGNLYFFPFTRSAEADRYATALSQAALPAAGRFAVYGWEPQVHAWRDWFRARPELEGWHEKRLGPFADVDVEVFEK
jgi:hypothetical protein